MGRRTKWSVLTVGVAGLIVGLAISASFDWTATSFGYDKVEQQKIREELQKALPTAEAMNQIYRNVYKLVSPSVVSITTERKAKIARFQRDPHRNFRRDLPKEWQRYFEFDFPDLPNTPNLPKEFGEGSGIIVDEQGHVLTNAHVVDGMDGGGKIKARLINEKWHDATVVAVDKKSDLAVLKIDAPDLIPAQLGDSDALQVGDQVAAFGSPFNLPETFSLGIVSALGRSRVDVIPGEFRVQNFIQTDAAINPGNSGGPLVNMRGEVIGINSAIATKSGSYNGIGFAIPTSIAKPVMEALIAHKKVVRGYLGVQIADLNDLIAEKEGYKNVKEMSEKLGLGGKTGGALVKMVMAKTPAFKAGVQPEDVIVEYQGQPVKDVEDLRNRVSLTPVGANAAMKVVRDGKPIVLTVPIAEQPEEGTLASVEAEPPGETGAPSFGITPQRLTPDLAKKHGYEADEGVLIGEVGQGSPADLAGLREGVLVREVDGKPVKTIKEFNEAMAAAQKSKKVKLLVRSEEGLAVVVLRVGAEE